MPLILLQKMELLLKKTPQEDIKRHILPMIIRSLETEHGQLQVRRGEGEGGRVDSVTRSGAAMLCGFL